MKHKETCGFYRGNEFCSKTTYCMAKGLLENQAKSGGAKNPEGTRPGGPFFYTSEWIGLNGRTIQIARRVNCHELSSLEQIAQKLTQQKIEKGELLPDFQRPQDLPSAA